MKKFLNLRKLDRRFTAYPFFRHMIEVRPNYTASGFTPSTLHLKPNFTHFFEIREWLWESYGPSKELKHWIKHHRENCIEGTSHNVNWCWDTEYYEYRIYLSEDALTSFTLRWL